MSRISIGKSNTHIRIIINTRKYDLEKKQRFEFRLNDNLINKNIK